MRLTLLIGVLCLAYCHAESYESNVQPTGLRDVDLGDHHADEGLRLPRQHYAKYENNVEPVGLLDVDDQGDAHANEGERLARQWGGGWGGRGGGWGGGGWGRGGGWGGRGWGGGW